MMFSDEITQTPDDLNINLGTALFQGTKFKDNMCLYQTREHRTDQTGFLCVRQMPFLLAKDIIGEFTANGVLGLAPGENSYISQLHSQGQVPEMKVGMNFEDPSDKSSISTMTFGYFDLD